MLLEVFDDMVPGIGVECVCLSGAMLAKAGTVLDVCLEPHCLTFERRQNTDARRRAHARRCVMVGTHLGVRSELSGRPETKAPGWCKWKLMDPVNVLFPFFPFPLFPFC